MKKVLSVLLSLVLCLGMIPARLPLTAVATTTWEDVTDNSANNTLEELSTGKCMNTNYGTIRVNNGWVRDNYGVILTNTGTITTNDSSGKVYNNTGTILNDGGVSYTVEGGTSSTSKGTSYFHIKLADGTSNVTLTAESSDLEGDEKQYIKTGSTATLTANAGYVIKSATTGDVHGTVENGGKTCTFTFETVSAVTTVSAEVEPAGTSCQSCNYEFNGNVGTCTACGDKVTVTVTGVDNLTYNGQNHEPNVTVTRGETTLVESTDYQVSYADNKSAGDATVSVKIGSDGSQGTYTQAFSIAPAALTVDTITGTKQYDGTNEVDITSVTLSGKIGSDDVAADISGLKGTVSGADVGTYGQVTLPELTLTGTAAGNYTLTQPQNPVSATMEITQATKTPKTGELSVTINKKRDYTFDLSTLLPDLPAGQSFGSPVTYTLGTVSLGNYYDGTTNGATINGSTLTLPIEKVADGTAGDIGTIAVTIKTQNFADMDTTINVKSVDKDVPTGTPTLSANTLTYGQPLSSITLSGSMTAPGGVEVTGTFAWDDGSATPGVGSYSAPWMFTPDDNAYAEVKGTANITVNPASIAGAEVQLTNKVFIEAPNNLSAFGDIFVTSDTGVLTENIDYTLTIEGSKVVATGKGNYTGTASADFEIAPLGEEVQVKDGNGNPTSLYLQVSTVLEPLPSNSPYDTVEKIQQELTKAVGSGYTIVYRNVRLVDQNGDEASYDKTQTGPITVTLPYPDEIASSASRYDFTVKHMKHDGSIEDGNAQQVAGGLQCTFKGLSPVAIGYKLKSGDGSGGSGGSGGGGGSWVTYYPIKVITPEHGMLRSDRTSMYAGGTVTLTPTAAEGYRLAGITVTDTSGKAVELTERNGKYTFKMPGRGVEARAEFAPVAVETPTPEPTETPSPEPTETPTPEPTGTPTPEPTGSPSPEPWKNPYPDVKADDWFYHAVEFVSREGLMRGYANGKFGPYDTITRAQFAQILYNKAGRPSAGSAVFTDVTGGWYAAAVNWAAAQGIVTGVGGGRFAPDDPITREELAVMLWRYAGSPEPRKNQLGFTDSNQVSKYAWKALCWASENGIMNGRGGGVLDPAGTAKRSEAAQMLMNALEMRLA